jgi:CHAT domain-containing protein/tetratricopeptide (TPR) repeat protein
LAELGELYRLVADYQAAEPVFQEATQICRIAGAARPGLGAALTNLGLLYLSVANYVAAEAPLREAMSTAAEERGVRHPDYAASLCNLAALLVEEGNYAEAEPLAREAIDIFRAASPDDRRMAIILGNIGSLYYRMGNYTAAKDILQRVLDTVLASYGEHHQHYANSLQLLAEVYRALGQLDAAEPLLNKALEVRRGLEGDDHPDVAGVLNGLALLYYHMGRYASAMPLYEQALKTYVRVFGRQSPITARVLNNLGELCRVMGDYEKAERHLSEAVDIRRATLPNDHPDLATSLNNLAVLYDTMGDILAGNLYRDALKIRGKLGESNPSFAQSLNNLAEWHETRGNLAEAITLSRRAMEVNRTMGEKHPEFGSSLSNLASLYACQGDYARAEPLLRQAVEIFRGLPGGDHPLLAVGMGNLSVLCVATDRPAEAFALLSEIAVSHSRMIAQVFSVTSERARIAYLRTHEGHFAALLSLVRQHFRDCPHAVHCALDLVLRRKAIALEALAVRRDAILGGRYPHVEPQLRQLQMLRMQIAHKTLAGPGTEVPEEHQRCLAQWNGRKERMEAEMARQIPEMELEERLRAADRRAVALQLPEGVALVEFIRFRVFDFHAVAEKVDETHWRAPRWWKDACYLAFVLLSREPDKVQMIDLGEAEEIDQLIADFRNGIIGRTGGNGKRDMILVKDIQETARVGDDGSRLRKAVFDKLRPALSGRTRLFLAADGELTRLPFEALPSGDGRRLIDEYRISYVNVGRDVLRFGAPYSGRPGDPLVIADPDFRLAAVVARPEPAGSHERVLASLPTRGMARHSQDLASAQLHFCPLPATRIEGQHVAGRLGSTAVLGSDALESRVKQVCRSPWAPRILHLATHGYFLENQAIDLNSEQRWLVGGMRSTAVGDRFRGPLPENPLLRSALALAGAETWVTGGQPPEEAEDGLLTAEDVSGLDLIDTELVVLSACDTGLGEVHSGEGVFGLRRAFVLAGAKTLVMSLWHVPDLATAILMERFYGNLLDRGLPRDEALRRAQVHVRDLKVGAIRDRWLMPAMIESLSAGNKKDREYLESITRQPDDYRPFEHPYYWAAFICQGDPALLPDNAFRD